MDKKEESPEDGNVEVYFGITTFKYMIVKQNGSKGECKPTRVESKHRSEVSDNLQTAKESLHDAVDLEHAKTT